MNSLVNTLFNGATGLKKALCLLSLMLYVALTVYSGGSIIEIMVFGLLMIVYIWLPGKCWNMLLAADKRFENISFGLDILLGSGFFCGVYCVAMRRQMKILLAVIPLIFAGLCIALIIRRSCLTPPP